MQDPGLFLTAVKPENSIHLGPTSAARRTRRTHAPLPASRASGKATWAGGAAQSHVLKCTWVLLQPGQPSEWQLLCWHWAWGTFLSMRHKTHRASLLLSRHATNSASAFPCGTDLHGFWPFHEAYNKSPGPDKVYFKFLEGVKREFSWTPTKICRKYQDSHSIRRAHESSRCTISKSHRRHLQGWLSWNYAPGLLLDTTEQEAAGNRAGEGRAGDDQERWW